MRSGLLVAAVLLLIAPGGCNDEGTTPPGGDVPQTGDGPSKSDGLKTGDATKTPDQKRDSQWGNNQPACSGTVYKCSNGKDDDGDGKVDSLDPECVGPCDDDEASFGTGIPGDNMDSCKQDCFFDGNSGAGGGDCQWNLKCDPLSPGANLKPPCPYDSAYKSCDPAQTEACKKICLPLAPNGCDCFGCCEIFANGVKMMVFLGSGAGCSTATPDKCAKCTPTTTCVNTCEECELCLGKTIADLPAKCFPAKPDGAVKVDAGLPLPQCPAGITPCLTNAQCPTNYYCTTGCCIKAIE